MSDVSVISERKIGKSALPDLHPKELSSNLLRPEHNAGRPEKYSTQSHMQKSRLPNRNFLWKVHSGCLINFDPFIIYCQSVFCPRYCTTNIFFNYLNPVLLVFIWKLLLSTIRWVQMCQGSSRFSTFFQIILFCPNQPPAAQLRAKISWKSRMIPGWFAKKHIFFKSGSGNQGFPLISLFWILATF